jgi:CheY-like chemotaxis protein
MMRTVMGERIRIGIEATSEPCWVEADVGQFETALVNMAVNARDAMDGEGTLTVRVECMPRRSSTEQKGQPAGPRVAVSLTDTGSGIAPEHLARLFEPFFTTKEVGKGTGLGLSQVYGFAKQSGGNVLVQSEVGSGTTFTLYLPHVEHVVVASDGARHDAAPPDPGQGRRVLMVEDNVEVGTFATQLLNDLGYETTWAVDSNDAMARLEEAQGEFDVIFSDVVLPGRSGVELGREIRRRYPNLPIVLTSGYSHTLAEEKRHGFELLRKPYTVEDLSRVLARISPSGESD